MFDLLAFFSSSSPSSLRKSAARLRGLICLAGSLLNLGGVDVDKVLLISSSTLVFFKGAAFSGSSDPLLGLSDDFLDFLESRSCIVVPDVVAAIRKRGQQTANVAK